MKNKLDAETCGVRSGECLLFIRKISCTLYIFNMVHQCFPGFCKKRKIKNFLFLFLYNYIIYFLFLFYFGKKRKKLEKKETDC